MAGAGVQIDESTHLPGRSADEVSSRILTAVATVPGHRCATVGPGTHKVARSYRRPLAFLRNRTDVCTITVVDAPLGVVVTTVGTLVPDARAAMEAAMANVPAPSVERPADVTTLRPPPPAVARPADVTTYRPAAAPRQPAEPTVVPRAPVAPPAPTPAPVRRAVLRFDTGQVVTIGGAVVVVGRDPSALDGDANPQLVAIDDPARTVSKTHFACGQDDRSPWVEDRHSTNGTSITDGRNRRATLVAGRRTRVPVDVTIIFGDRTATLTLDA